MILQALVDYYDALAKRGEIARPGWCLEKVSFALNISLKGELLGVIPTVQEMMREGKKVDVPRIMEVPERVVRSSGIKANFLCDNSSYLLGFDEKGKPERAIKCFEACKAHHLNILKHSRGAAATAVKTFFEQWVPIDAIDSVISNKNIKNMSVANLVFMIDGDIFAQEDGEIRELWQAYNKQKESSVRQRCLVTGKIEPIMNIHGKIKGVKGAQSSGASLVSFNASAYESYGQGDDKNTNAPISEYAAFAYVTAINRLVTNPEHSRRIGDSTVVYWAEQADPKPQKVFSLFCSPEPETDSLLDGMMHNISMGKSIDDIDMSKRFYVLGLAPNAARVSIRFFFQSSLSEIIKNIHQHYERIEIIKPAFDNRQYLSVPSLLWETINPKSKKKEPSPLLSGAVMRTIITRGEYPQALFTAVLTRIRAESKVTRGRAAIIKAYLIRNHQEEEVTSVALNESTDNRAYVLGRLFAVLEDAQLQANPKIKATIKDRYFTSACATPGNVFPQLLKLSTFHTAKAEYGISREIEKTRLLDKLGVENNPFPTHHTLQEQGTFILGYYHQVQFRYTKKEDK